MQQCDTNLKTNEPLSIRVMVVEDSPEFMTSFAHAITSAPDMRLVAIASRFKTACELIPVTDCDVLLVDLGLPDGSGIDLIRQMKGHCPQCQSIVTTVFGDETHVLQSIMAGATGYLLKDSQPAKVTDEIRNLHQGGSPISPLIARRVLQQLTESGGVPAMHAVTDPTVRLSPREIEVLRLFAHGFSHDEIARQIEVSRHTVLTFVRRIYGKLQVNSKMDAVNEARRMGLIN